MAFPRRDVSAAARASCHSPERRGLVEQKGDPSVAFRGMVFLSTGHSEKPAKSPEWQSSNGDAAHQKMT
jgi:hypothetical protein